MKPRTKRANGQPRTKIVIQGPPKSGKTHLTNALTAAGFKLEQDEALKHAQAGRHVFYSDNSARRITAAAKGLGHTAVLSGHVVSITITPRAA